MEYFKDSEFNCYDGTPYPEEWKADRLSLLKETLNVIRESAGGPIRVTPKGGYRTLAVNTAIGGVRQSQHMEGRAADIVCDAQSPSQLHRLILALYKAGQLPHLGGLGKYPRFTHIDVRPQPEGHLARWQGTRRAA